MSFFSRLFGKKNPPRKQLDPNQLLPELQSILQQLSQPARITDMPHRVQLCQQALALVRREQNAPLWAALQDELGNSLAQNPLGDRAENLE
ncbi:MAG: hypothetical protein WA029_10720, partial [Anaerolineae bacterium]